MRKLERERHKTRKKTNFENITIKRPTRKQRDRTTKKKEKKKTEKGEKIEKKKGVKERKERKGL